MNEKSRYVVEIFGESYSLVSDESAGHVQASAALVDKLMKEVVGVAGTIDHRRVAVLVALKLASEALHHQKKLQSQEDTLHALAEHQENLIRLLERELAQLSHS